MPASSRVRSAFSGSFCEWTETNSPAAIDMAPAIKSETLVTSTGLAVDTMPSLAPSTAARSQPIRSVRWCSVRWAAPPGRSARRSSKDLVCVITVQILVVGYRRVLDGYEDVSCRTFHKGSLLDSARRPTNPLQVGAPWVCLRTDRPAHRGDAQSSSPLWSLHHEDRFATAAGRDGRTEVRARRARREDRCRSEEWRRDAGR